MIIGWKARRGIIFKWHHLFCHPGKWLEWRQIFAVIYPNLITIGSQLYQQQANCKRVGESLQSGFGLSSLKNHFMILQLSCSHCKSGKVCSLSRSNSETPRNPDLIYAVSSINGGWHLDCLSTQDIMEMSSLSVPLRITKGLLMNPPNGSVTLNYDRH